MYFTPLPDFQPFLFQGVGGLRRAVQAATNQAGRHSERCRKSPRKSQAAGSGGAITEHDMQVYPTEIINMT